MVKEKAAKQNILVVHNRYKIRGGEDAVFENEVKLLKDNGHNVITYERNNNEIDGFSFFKKLLIPFSMIFSFKTYKDIRKLIRENSIEIVHVHNVLNLVSPSVFYAACKEKTPVINTIHNFRMVCPGAMLFRNDKLCEECLEEGRDIWNACKYGCYRGSKLQTFIYVLSQKIHRFTGIYKKINFICLTEFNKNILIKINKNGRYVNENNIYVRGNFCSSVLNDASYVKSFETRKKDDYVIFAGRLDKMKGFDTLLKLYESDTDKKLPRLIVCGPGEEKSFPENVEYKGILKRDELMRIMSGAMALILPTKWYEGFPMSIIESYSVGTPVLTSNFGNANQIAKGITFNPDNMEEMKNAILECRNFKENICEEVYDLYLSDYSNKKAYTTLADIYNRL